MTALMTLMMNVDKLPVKDQAFAKSLLAQARVKQLSSKQQYWVGKLADQVTQPQLPLDPPQQTKEVGSMTGVLELFAKASKKLKHPKIRLETPAGRQLALSVAGPFSKEPGSIQLTDGAGYGQNFWYGRVTPEGDLKPSPKLSGDVVDDLTSILTQLSIRPAQTAAQYGKMTGHCCFCMAKLSDPKSVDAGYGKTCAKNYGLPWG